MRILVIYGSVREKRQGIKVAKFVVNRLKDMKFDVALIDPLEYDFGLLNKLTRDYSEEEIPEMMKRLRERIMTCH